VVGEQESVEMDWKGSIEEDVGGSENTQRWAVDFEMAHAQVAENFPNHFCK
jgi:hypothetical protein